MPPLAARLAEVDADIASASRAAGRQPDDITRIVVTKFHLASLVEELVGLGVRDVGENRQQELTEKAPLFDHTDLQWHFIGQLQTKKAKAVRACASVVQSVDRDRVADALDRAAESPEDVLDVLVQINLTNDPQRGGVSADQLDLLVEHVLSKQSLRLRGVMAVAPLDEEPGRAFERLAGYADRVRSLAPSATWISAGMSHDFAEAIRHGATHLRIGTAITGSRPHQG